jgi:hypothetical protein
MKKVFFFLGCLLLKLPISVLSIKSLTLKIWVNRIKKKIIHIEQTTQQKYFNTLLCVGRCWEDEKKKKHCFIFIIWVVFHGLELWQGRPVLVADMTFLWKKSDEKRLEFHCQREILKIGTKSKNYSILVSTDGIIKEITFG